MKKYAEQLSDVLMQIADLQLEAKGIVDAAKDEGIDVAALKKVAREMIMDGEKLQKRLDAEAQLDLFREEVGLLKRKGLVSDLARERSAAQAELVGA
jgi:uncharacterized protein (UPF0335 family)